MALTIDCFFCYEKIVIPNEEEFSYSEFIWDCDVCCNPNLIKYQLKNEEITNLEVTSGNEWNGKNGYKQKRRIDLCLWC